MPKVRPRLLYADPSGEIFDSPELLMICRRGAEFALPRPDELTPLPEESELFMLPGRNALGLDPETGNVEQLDMNAVAAFASPGYTLAATAAYSSAEGAPTLPLFAYGAVGYANGKLWVAAKRVDPEPRQVFAHIPTKRIRSGATALLKRYPKNRLIQHLAGCALTNCCPAARNLCLGRYEAPLPTARACNARCIGCLSLQEDCSGFPSTQQRITFTPTAAEIVEVMEEHATREKRPIFSFGQGCEGEPLTEAERIAEAVAGYRSRGGKGTVNINTNASLPGAIPPLAEAGLDSIRVSLTSATPDFYEAYYRPKGYSFADVDATIAAAKDAGLFVSLNFIYFPGVSDTEEEFESLAGLVERHNVDCIQMRNLNLDPELYLDLAGARAARPSMGLKNFLKRLRKRREGLRIGYFNPYLGEDADGS